MISNHALQTGFYWLNLARGCFCLGQTIHFGPIFLKNEKTSQNDWYIRKCCASIPVRHRSSGTECQLLLCQPQCPPVCNSPPPLPLTSLLTHVICFLGSFTLPGPCRHLSEAATSTDAETQRGHTHAIATWSGMTAVKRQLELRSI